MNRTRTEFPQFPIEPILIELGAESVPDGYGSGGWVKMHCPFHPDRTKSASVNHEKNAFNCFSCGRKGDSVKMLMTELGLEISDAIRRAEAISGVEGGKPRRKRRASSTLLNF